MTLGSHSPALAQRPVSVGLCYHQWGPLTFVMLILSAGIHLNLGLIDYRLYYQLNGIYFDLTA